jgi:hypothetical protein
MSPGRTVIAVVAGDRYGRLSRIDGPDIIDLGTWQVELVKAIGKYLKKSQQERDI